MASDFGKADVPTLFEESVEGRVGVSLFEEDENTDSLLENVVPQCFRRSLPLGLPELSELQVMRHFIRLSNRTLGVDTTFYPLGSCTMKYNPKVNELTAADERFLYTHPFQPQRTLQGILKICFELCQWLGELTGLRGVSLQPAAGAHGEFTALLIAKAYFRERGESQRTQVLVPDTAHGTNPASAARCGFVPVAIKSKNGKVDLDELQRHIGEKTACLMITNPNTLGLFEDAICEISHRVHEAGGLVYLDGANFNAMVGRVRPSDFGADLMHINLHKTFSVPHGSGGPGAGPICVREELAKYLPVPILSCRDGFYYLEYDRPHSVGRVRSFLGNIPNVVRAYTYIAQLGYEGLCEVSGFAVLHANYLLHLLSSSFDVPYGARCMHEFVIDGSRQKKFGVKALDIAKKLLDYGYHPPTTYFPLIVPEALMVEPTETENKETLESFANAMIEISNIAETHPEEITDAPRTTPVSRLDELSAARNPVVVWPNV
ncbi:MAG: aminomethyl-transferring glycine dehydrogenase subunit GcvPB [Candidatus Sumerlaeaceae bacterium]|nr:aminomethyl-transferring glycine dehydrogenase subunit GcvPB [Candidatus Sumerlaeaceae bacterium]